MAGRNNGKMFLIVVALAGVCIPVAAQQHSADVNGDFAISLSELLRVIQFFNSDGLHCETSTEDGYAPGQGDQTCDPHDSDYIPQDWHINLSELLRVIQFFNIGGYHTQCDSEDTFAPGAGSHESCEGEEEGLSEGQQEGTLEGEAEGEGAEEGIAEGQVEGEGSPEGEGNVEGEGDVEGTLEGSTEGAMEGSLEGQEEGAIEGMVEGEGDVEGRPEGEICIEGECETILLPGNVPLEMVWIPGGTFMMGRYPGEQDGYDDEEPQHPVTVPGFWMGKYELTQAQWKAVMNGANPSYFQGDNRPVECVSWNTITQTFLPALNTATGLTFRLPSEAEWEYAARAGTATRFYWGDDLGYTEIGSYAWYYFNSGNQTHDVGTAGGTGHPNAFGLYDMSGNVWEWCEDDWHYDYIGAPTGGGAWVESPRASSRVGRGGCWYDYGNGGRSAARGYDSPSSTSNFLGFRLSR